MKSPVETYIVRVYRRTSGSKRQLVGLIEAPQAAGLRGFTNVEQLWEILSDHVSVKRAPTSSSPARAKDEHKLRGSVCAAAPISDTGGDLED